MIKFWTQASATGNVQGNNRLYRCTIYIELYRNQLCSLFTILYLISPTLDKLGALTNELLRGVPPKGTPFPRINGPKKDDKVMKKA